MPVTGVEGAKKKLRRYVPRMMEYAALQLEKEAEKIVQLANALKPHPGITVGWSWPADVPRGAFVLREFRNREYSAMRIVIWAVGSTDSGRGVDGYVGVFPILAAWFEFGTGERVQKTTGRKTGKMLGQSGGPAPFFFPAYRDRKKNVRANLRRAVSRAIRDVEAGR